MSDDLQKPSSQRAIVLESFDKPMSIVNDKPVPEALPGSVVVKILATPLARYIRTLYSGNIPVPRLEPPFVPNPKALGRIYEVGAGAVKVKEGDLVYVEAGLLGRDDPNTFILLGLMKGLPGPNTDRLAEGIFRDGSLQQYQRVPLENVFPIDERRVKERGVDPINLVSIASYSMAAGAIFEAGDVKITETVIVGPSGGSFGGSAVELALAVGANVVALGRDAEKLAEMKQRLHNPRLATVIITGDIDVDAAAILAATPRGAGADVYNDWSPGGLPSAPYLPAAERAIKRGGRIVISGGALGVVEVPYVSVVLKKLKVEGSWMCNRESMERLIRMIEDGHIDIGARSGIEVTKFDLDEIYRAIDHAEETTRWGKYTVVVPNPFDD